MLMTRMKLVAGLLVVGLMQTGSGLISGLAIDQDNPQDPAAAIEPYDEENRVAVSFTEDSQRFGIALLRQKDPRDPKKPKLLTRHQRGESNNTVVRIDGFECVFGRESPGAGIKWKVVDGKVQKEIKSKGNRKVVSTMRYDKERIEITQTVQIVVGVQTRLHDTALVTYQIENRDDRGHAVALRVLLDTSIGGKNGCPSFIPPTDDTPQAQLIDTKLVLEKAKIPPFIRILESDNLNDPNMTVADMGLKLKGLEPLDKLVICRWPQEWGGAEARWEWPFAAINEPKDKPMSSCVVLYWAKQDMKPGQKRTCGFTYGLGRISNAVWYLTLSSAVVSSGRVDRISATWDLPLPAPRQLKPDEVETLWNKLGDESALNASQAMLELAVAAEQSVAFFEKHLRPVSSDDQKAINRWAADLSSDSFDTRQKAAEKLEQQGERARGALEKILAGKPHLDLLQRVERLLAKVDSVPLSTEQRQAVRALRVLERIGTGEARMLLESVAGGLEGARVTGEAAAALKRLADKPVTE